VNALPQSLVAAFSDRYRLERELGQGGMATVYLAQDLKHHRAVAVKVLRPELAASLGSERFLREIEIAATLRHPHILPLFDSGVAAAPHAERSAGPASEFLYYVMPYVEGESLRDRLNRETQLPLEAALQIAREVGDALSYAHNHGVVHRDIKPENILLESGHAVVTDFGIARAVSAAGNHRLTETGLVLGTAAYMSPEQAAGDREIDGRSDLYGLGCVLFEMLAGQPPFTGPTVQSVVHQHVTAPPPPVTQFRPAVPAAVVDALTRALAKTPADRFNPLAQFTAALGGTGMSPAVRATRRPRGAVLVLIALALAAATILMARRSGGDRLPVIERTTQVTRAPGLEVDPALSPDGGMIAYAAGPPTRMQIFVRQVAGGRTVALTGDSTVNHRWPRWSPDGSRIAYQTDQGIWTVPALGGQPRLAVSLSEDSVWAPGSSRLAGFAWSPDGRLIAYARGFRAGGIVIAPLDSGGPRQLGGIRDGHSLAWSPDGTALALVSDNPEFVFGDTYFGNEGSSSIWIAPVDGRDPVRVTDDEHTNMSPQWSRDGRHLLWVSSRGGGRDIYRVRVSRTGTPVGAPDRLTTGADAQTFSLSADGTRLAYASFRTFSNIWALPIPTSGPVSARQARPVTRGRQTIEDVDISRDGRSLVFDSDQNGNFDIYRLPVGGEEPIQLTSDSAADFNPKWSPDGRFIAFHSLRHGNRDVFTMAADGSDLTRRSSSAAHELDADWSPDGEALVAQYVDTLGVLGAEGFMILSLDGGPVRMIDQIGDFAMWSPAGNVIAYHASDGLRVFSPREPGSRLLVDKAGEGGEPFYSAWSPDGRTLYYIALAPQGASIRSVPAAGGRSRLLVRFDDPERQQTRYGFATDGRTLYFTMGSHESDIWVMDLRR
jgi:serine/threonine-protein kinase